MSDFQELAWAGVARLGELLRRREVSAGELARGFVERLERVGPRLNALASLLPERTLAEAERADRELASGRDRGPLHGIPYGAKDLLAARGAPTTWGAPPYRDQVIDRDATAVRRLGRAGAVLAAKLAMVELAGGGGYRFPSASLQGPGRTPWNPDHWSGGSSSGSGSAVAAALVPYAIGSETSGSIVTPASYCGVTGLRPTYGLVSRAGAMPLSWTLDKLGPLARSAADCRVVLDALAGVDAADATTSRPPRRLAARSAKPRVGFAPADFDELAAEGSRPAFAAALRAFRDLDVELVEASLPADLPYGGAVRVVIAAEASSIFGDLIRSGRVDELVDEQQRTALKLSLEIPASAYLDAMRARGLIQEAFQQLFGRVDMILSVGRNRGATRIDEPVSPRPFGAAYSPGGEARPNNAGLIPGGNLAGLPAVCFPCGFDADGLPVALQLVAPPFQEALLLDTAERWQQATDWHTRRPPNV